MPQDFFLETVNEDNAEAFREDPYLEDAAGVVFEDVDDLPAGTLNDFFGEPLTEEEEVGDVVEPTIPEPEPTVQEPEPAAQDPEASKPPVFAAKRTSRKTPRRTASREAAEPTDYTVEEPTSAASIPHPLQGLSKRERKRVNDHNLMVTLAFAFVLLLFGIINIITPVKEVSYQENRLLAQRPKFTLSSLSDGSYFAGCVDFFSDQFFGRDGWISLHLFGDRLTGRKEENNVYLGKDHYLIQQPEEPDYTVVADKTEAILDFANTYDSLRMNVLVIPSPAVILEDKLPYGAYVNDQQEVVSSMLQNLKRQVLVPDVTEVLEEHSDEQLFYKTDHHWTSLGAYEVFLTLRETLGLDRAPVEYKTYTVSDSFEGTLSSESGSHGTKDTIEIYVPTDSEFYVNYPSTQTKSRSPYVSRCLDDKDQYTVFFGGNHSVVEILTTVHNHRNLLVIKDSYANCFVPLLTPYYEKIIMVDPRYFYDDIARTISQNEITDVLFLYSADTFVTDTTLIDVLNSVK